MDDSIHQGNKWFKYRIHGWLKSVDDERMDYVPSKRSSKSSSKDFSKKQTSSSGCSSVNEKSIQEQINIEELKAEHSFME